MKSKTEAKLEKYGVTKQVYYYDEYETTVCILIKGDQILARGVSSCSDRDEFIKRKGRTIALGHAVQALHHQKNLNWVMSKSRKNREYERFEYLRIRFGCLSCYMPSLWQKEVNIVNKACNNGT